MTSYISDLLIKFDALKFIVWVFFFYIKDVLTLKEKMSRGVSVNINQLVLQDNNSNIKM